MDKEKAEEALETLREYLMEEMKEASSRGDEARVDEVQNGRTALSGLRRVVGG